MDRDPDAKAVDRGDLLGKEKLKRHSPKMTRRECKPFKDMCYMSLYVHIYTYIYTHTHRHTHTHTDIHIILATHADTNTHSFIYSTFLFTQYTSILYRYTLIKTKTHTAQTHKSPSTYNQIKTRHKMQNVAYMMDKLSSVVFVEMWCG